MAFIEILFAAVFALLCIGFCAAVIFCGSDFPLHVPRFSNKKGLVIIGSILVILAYAFANKFLPHIDLAGKLLDEIYIAKEKGAAENSTAAVIFIILEYFFIALDKANGFLLQLLDSAYIMDGRDIAQNWKAYLLGLLITVASYFVVVFVTRTGSAILDSDLQNASEVDRRNSEKKKDLYLETRYDVDHNRNLTATTRLVDNTKYENYSFVIFQYIGGILFSSFLLPGATLVFLGLGLVFAIVRRV